MTVVYYSLIEKKLERSEVSRYLELLPDGMRSRILHFHNWEDSHASLYGKLLLSKLLIDYDLPFSLLDLKYTKFKKPYLDSSIDFNIAHSGKCVVCVLTTDGRIGIDVEVVRPIDWLSFSNIFNGDELCNIQKDSNELMVFYSYWTIKEAVVKADGRGLAVSLKYVRIDRDEAVLEGVRWFLRNIDFGPGYAAHIALEKPINGHLYTRRIVF